MASPVEKPDHLKNPRRAFVKRNGKKLVRKIAAFQSRQSKVPDTPKIPNEHFDFLDRFTENWETIQAEAREVLKFRDAIPTFHEVSPDQYRLSTENNWKTFVLFGFGVTKGILRSHLGLIIPKDREKCRIRVDDTITPWKEGEIFVFDDTYEHEVWNETDEERVILLFDFDRPMKFAGRVLNTTFLNIMKLTAFYQDPKKNLQTAEERLEAAIRQADANLEAMSDPAG